MLCQFERTPDGAVKCDRCNQPIALPKALAALDFTTLRRRCPAPAGAPRYRRPPPRPHGPGTELKRLLAELKIAPTSGCGCDAQAAQMNAWGAAGCRARIYEIAGRLRDNAAKHGTTEKLTAAAAALRRGGWKLLLTGDPYRALVGTAIAAAEERDRARQIKTRHLLYHIWPVAGNDMWRWNVERLLGPKSKVQSPKSDVEPLPYSSPFAPREESPDAEGVSRLDQFNGRRLIAVALDDLTVPLDDVRRAFDGHDVEILPRKNDPRLREASTFLELLEAVQTHEPTHATFYAHAKGSSRRGDMLLEVIRRWSDCMYTRLLDDPGAVAEALRTLAMYGVRFPSEPRWQYPGTFWWFHNATVFENDEWRKLENPVGNEGPGWAVEAFPDRMFAASECAGPIVELPPVQRGLDYSLYAPEVWGLPHRSLSDILATFDETAYLESYPDVAAGVAAGDWPSGAAHFAARGYYERRPV